MSDMIPAKCDFCGECFGEPEAIKQDQWKEVFKCVYEGECDQTDPFAPPVQILINHLEDG